MPTTTTTILPSPITLTTLRDTYDQLVHCLNQQQHHDDPNSPDDYERLAHVCAILLAILEQYDPTRYTQLSPILLQTAHRCHDDLPAIQVTHVENELWSWRYDLLLTLSPTELAQEEAALLQMASTPVPGES